MEYSRDPAILSSNTTSSVTPPPPPFSQKMPLLCQNDMKAAVYNLISALSAVFGVILILALRDDLTSAQVSTILLIGAGSFVFVALSELVPEALEVHPAAAAGGKREVVGSQVRKLASFMVGALIVGIPLIFDQHCDAGHVGHDH